MKTFHALLLTLLTLQTYCQTATVTPDKLKVFYKGLDNPITVVVEDCSRKDLVVKTNVGRISGEGCHYNVWITDSASEYADVYVGVLKKKKINWVDTIKYRLKIVPDPTPFVYGLTGGQIEKECLLNAQGIIPKQDSYGMSFVIMSFSSEISRNDSIIFKSEKSWASRYFPDFIKFVQQSCISNDVVRFYNIIAMGDDGFRRKLKEMVFRIK